MYPSKIEYTPPHPTHTPLPNRVPNFYNIFKAQIFVNNWAVGVRTRKLIKVTWGNSQRSPNGHRRQQIDWKCTTSKYLLFLYFRHLCLRENHALLSRISATPSPPLFVISLDDNSQPVDCALGKFRWWWRLLLICSNHRQPAAIIYVGCMCVKLVLLRLKYLMNVFCAQLKQEPSIARNVLMSVPARCHSHQCTPASACGGGWLVMQELQNPNSHFNVPNSPSSEKVFSCRGARCSFYIYISKHQVYIHTNMKKISFLIPQCAHGVSNVALSKYLRIVFALKLLKPLRYSFTVGFQVDRRQISFCLQ